MKNILLTTALGSCAFTSAALAQELASAQGLTQSQRDTLIVTALRREQSPQDVSIALTALSGDDLNTYGITNINGLENVTPGLEIENQFGSGQPSFSIRGVGFRDYATLNAPSVGIYVDDVAYPIPVTTQGVLFDIERVEVLRGPQGTLYGRNTTGGAIKIISARPTEEFAAGFNVEGGRFGRVDSEAYVSGPITDKIRFRLSGATANGGDWQVNRETGQEIGSVEKYAARGLLDFDINDTWQASVNLHGFLDNSDGLGLQLFNDSTFGPLAHEGRRETSFGSSTAFADLVGISETTAPFRNNEGWGLSGVLRGDIGFADVIYIGSFENINRQEFNDFDALAIGGAGVYFETSADVASHELRFSGESDRLRWVAGAYYANEDLNELYQSDFVASFGPGFAVTTPYEQDVRTVAGFLHLDYDLTDKLTFIGGVRFEDESRELSNLGTFALATGPLNFANGSVDLTLEDRELDSENLSGKIGIDFKPVDDVLLYASYSRGVKSGGFTAYNTLNPQAIDPFTPEKLDAFEIGLKSSPAENITLNVSAFYYDYQDQQFQSAIFDEGVGAIVGRIVNAPESEIWGIEFETSYSPTPWFTIGQSFAWKEGQFNEFIDLDTAATSVAGTAVFIDRAGQDLGFPNISYQGFINVHREFGDRWIGGAAFNYSFRDDLTLPLLGPVFTVESYWLANAEISFGPADGRWELALWGRNIFNTDFDETRNFFIAPGSVADVAAPGLPATYGARISVAY